MMFLLTKIAAKVGILFGTTKFFKEYLHGRIILA